jgi:hypothetical protein
MEAGHPDGIFVNVYKVNIQIKFYFEGNCERLFYSLYSL